jgi:hypothetical protein
VEANRPAWTGAGAAIPDTASAPVIAKTIAIPLITLSSSWGRCGALTANIEVCGCERRLFVQLARNLIFAERTFNFVRPRDKVGSPVHMGRYQQAGGDRAHLQPDGQISKNLSSPFCKNILIFRRPKSLYIRSRPVPQRAYLHSTDLYAPPSAFR